MPNPKRLYPTGGRFDQKETKRAHALASSSTIPSSVVFNDDVPVRGEWESKMHLHFPYNYVISRNEWIMDGVEIVDDGQWQKIYECQRETILQTVSSNEIQESLRRLTTVRVHEMFEPELFPQALFQALTEMFEAPVDENTFYSKITLAIFLYHSLPSRFIDAWHQYIIRNNSGLSFVFLVLGGKLPMPSKLNMDCSEQRAYIEHNYIPVFHLAACCNQAGVIRQLIKFGFNPNVANLLQTTALHLASFYGYVAVVKELLQQNVVVNPVTSFGETPLQWAARFGHIDVLEHLLPHLEPDAVNQADKYGTTPLIWAVSTGRLPVIERLLNCENILYNQADNTGRTPLYWAAMHGYTSVVETLLKKTTIGKDLPDKKGITPLHAAVEFGHSNVVALLLNYSANPNIPDRNSIFPLMTAANKENVEIIDMLMTSRSLANECRIRVLKQAIERRSDLIVNALFRAGFYVSPVNVPHGWLSREMRRRVARNEEAYNNFHTEYSAGATSDAGPEVVLDMPLGYDSFGFWIVPEAVEGDIHRFKQLNHRSYALSAWFRQADKNVALFVVALRLASARLAGKGAIDAVTLTTEDGYRLYSGQVSVFEEIANQCGEQLFSRWLDVLFKAPELDGFPHFRSILRHVKKIINEQGTIAREQSLSVTMISTTLGIVSSRTGHWENLVQQYFPEYHKNVYKSNVQNADVWRGCYEYNKERIIELIPNIREQERLRQLPSAIAGTLPDSFFQVLTKAIDGIIDKDICLTAIEVAVFLYHYLPQNIHDDWYQYITTGLGSNGTANRLKDYIGLLISIIRYVSFYRIVNCEVVQVFSLNTDR